MKTTATKKIGNHEYQVMQLGTTASLDLLMDLVKMFGPGLAPVLNNTGELKAILDRDIADLKTEFLGDAVKMLCSGIDKQTMHNAFKVLSQVTIVTGQGKLSEVWEAHFSMNAGIGDLFQWVAFALTTQYDDFFSAFGSMIKSVSPQ